MTLHYEVELGLLMGEWVRSRNKFNKSRALNLVESMPDLTIISPFLYLFGLNDENKNHVKVSLS